MLFAVRSPSLPQNKKRKDNKKKTRGGTNLPKKVSSLQPRSQEFGKSPGNEVELAWREVPKAWVFRRELHTSRTFV